VIEMIIQELDTDIEPRYVDNPIPEHMFVHDTRADASAFEAATGWTPEIDFEQGIERVCEQYR
jgi:UDP-glucose 4-epimerase